MYYFEIVTDQQEILNEDQILDIKTAINELSYQRSLNEKPIIKIEIRKTTEVETVSFLNFDGRYAYAEKDVLFEED